MVIIGSVSGKPVVVVVVVVVVNGCTVVEKSRRMNCVFVNLNKTNAVTPRPRMVPRMRRIERRLGSVIGFFFVWSPLLTFFTG